MTASASADAWGKPSVALMHSMSKERTRSGAMAMVSSAQPTRSETLAWTTAWQERPRTPRCSLATSSGGRRSHPPALMPTASSTSVRTSSVRCAV